MNKHRPFGFRQSKECFVVVALAASLFPSCNDSSNDAINPATTTPQQTQSTPTPSPTSTSSLETSPPVTTASPGAGNYASAQTVTLSCSDASGCVDLVYTTNGATPNFSGTGTLVHSDSGTVSTTVNVLAGQTILKFLGRDSNGNTELVHTLSYVIDTTGPSTGADVTAGTYHAIQSVQLTCTDALTSCASIVYTTDGSTPSFPSSGTVVNAANATISIGSGNTTLKFRGKDAVGNVGTVTSIDYLVTLPCTGSTISSDGYAPCTRTCGTGSFELGTTNSGHTQCLCSSNYVWNSNGFCEASTAMKVLLSTF